MSGAAAADESARSLTAAKASAAPAFCYLSERPMNRAVVMHILLAFAAYVLVSSTE
jgi:hypothetical protein